MDVAAWLNGAVAEGVAGALAGGLCSYILFRLQRRADRLASRSMTHANAPPG